MLVISVSHCTTPENLLMPASTLTVEALILRADPASITTSPELVRRIRHPLRHVCRAGHAPFARSRA